MPEKPVPARYVTIYDEVLDQRRSYFAHPGDDCVSTAELGDDDAIADPQIECGCCGGPLGEDPR